MAFNRPTLQQIYDRVKNDFQSRLTSGSAVLRRSIISAWSRVIAGASHILHGHLDYISKQVFPDTAEVEYLDRWASIWGVTRKPADFAAGTVQFTGAVGSVIPEGTELKRSDGAIYTTDEELVLAGATGNVAVTASAAGESSNADTGTSLSLSSPIGGVQNSAVVQSPGITNGVDEESDDALRDRLILRIQNPPLGGSAADFKTWALEVSGITRAWVTPQNQGPGTVGIAIVSDTSDPIFPDNAKVDEVQDYIDERRPVTIEATVFAPTAHEVDFEINIEPNTVPVQNAIKAELKDLFEREGEPGGVILISHIREAISIAAGETDHTLISPNANVDAPDGQLPVLGDFTWS